MIHKILDKFSLSEIRRRYLNLKGIASKRNVYKGPDVVQIDLTDRCDGNCLICWLHSPLVKDKDTDKSELDFSVLKNFIGDVSKSGTKEIIFSGGGEPFSYPMIWEVLEFVQKNGLVFRINTNFILLNKQDIKRLLSFDKFISLTVSVWAGEAALYSRVHHRDADFFYRVKDNLKFINAEKSCRLDCKICAIVNNINYRGLKDLTGFSADTGCDVIEFGVTDAMPGVTDSFLLNREQLSVLKKDFISIAKNNSYIFNKEIFLRRISNPRACYGEYDTFIEKVPCYVGWLFLRLRANGDFNSCLKSHQIPIGNIYKDDFKSIWGSRRQREFREKSLSIPKEKGYFKLIGNGNGDDIGCKRVCDNILMNINLHRFIKYLFHGIGKYTPAEYK